MDTNHTSRGAHPQNSPLTDAADDIYCLSEKIAILTENDNIIQYLINVPKLFPNPDTETNSNCEILQYCNPIAYI